MRWPNEMGNGEGEGRIENEKGEREGRKEVGGRADQRPERTGGKKADLCKVPEMKL